MPKQESRPRGTKVKRTVCKVRSSLSGSHIAQLVKKTYHNLQTSPFIKRLALKTLLTLLKVEKVI